MKIIKQDLRTRISAGRHRYVEWYKNRMRHREDGPAVSWPGNRDIHDRFWLRGIRYYIEEYYVKIRLE